MAAAGLFLQTGSFEFLNYDDPDYVTSNFRVRQGLTPANLGWAFATGHAGNWHPLTWVSHQLDWQLFGARPGLHHVANATWHAANTLLLFLALRRLTGTTFRSFWVAALFAWHPLHVEAVAWVAQRKELLSAFWMFLGLLAYERYVVHQRAGHTPRTRRAWYAVVLSACLFGLMSKPTAVVFPLLLWLLDYWPLRRTGEPGAGGRLLVEKLPMLAACGVVAVVTFLVQRAGGAVSEELPWTQRLASAAVALVGYLGQLAWPTGLAVFYPHPVVWHPVVVAVSAGLFLTVTGCVVLRGRSRPYLVTGWFWYGVALLPTLGLVQVGGQFMADRYTYVPAIGIFIMASWAAGDAVRRWPWLRWPGMALAAGVWVACGLASHAQLGYWGNSGTLFTRALAVTRDNYVAWNNLGHHLLTEGQVEAASKCFQQALAIQPRHAEAWNNLGFVRALQGQPAEARAAFAAALLEAPGLGVAHFNLGRLEEAAGEWEAAMARYEGALRLDAHQPAWLVRAAVVLRRLGRPAEAEARLQQALKLQPGLAEARRELESLRQKEPSPDTPD